MGSEKHLGIVQLGELLVVDGYESQLLEPVAFYAVVHDVAQAIEPFALLQLLFGFLYGCGYTKAES